MDKNEWSTTTKNSRIGVYLDSVNVY